MTWLFYILLVVFLFICVVLTLLVLIQKGRGGGLASAFGGGSGNTAFGSKTGDVLTWATSVVFGIFLLLAIALNLVANRLHAATMESPAPLPIPVQPAPQASPGAANTAAQPVESAPATTNPPGTQPGN